MKTKLIKSNPNALNPPIDRMINNFITEGKYTLISVSNFSTSFLDEVSCIITYK